MLLMEIKETSILLSPEEIMELMGICEDENKEMAMAFAKKLHKKVEKTQGSFKSGYQRGGHIGPARF